MKQFSFQIAFLYEQNSFANIKKKNLNFAGYIYTASLYLQSSVKMLRKDQHVIEKALQLSTARQIYKSRITLLSSMVGCLNAIPLKTSSVILLSSQVQKGRVSFFKGIFLIIAYAL